MSQEPIILQQYTFEWTDAFDKCDQLLHSIFSTLGHEHIVEFIPAFAEQIVDIFPHVVFSYTSIGTGEKYPKTLFYSKKNISKSVEEEIKLKTHSFFDKFSSRKEFSSNVISLKNDNLISIPLYYLNNFACVFSASLIKDEITKDSFSQNIAFISHCMEHLHRVFKIIDLTREHALRDSLTSLYGRSHFDDFLTMNWSNVSPKCPFSFLLIDIDYFKKINDSYGHKMGDIVLQDLARIIKFIIPHSASAFRYGGDEIAIMLPSMNQQMTNDLAKKLLNYVRDYVFTHAACSVSITLSIGISGSECNEIKTAEDILIFADKAMYLAKRQGRNQVCSTDELKKENQEMDKFDDLTESETSFMHDKKTTQIMIVDDDEEILILLKIFLAKLKNTTIITFRFPEKALEYTLNRTEKIDILLTDLNMPKMDGFTLIKKIKESYSDVIPIILTGYSSSKNAMLAIKLGVYEFICKPFDLTQLETIMQRVIEKSIMYKKVNYHHYYIKELLNEKTKELGEALTKTETLKEHILQAMLRILECHEPSAAKHCIRVEKATYLLASQCDITNKEELDSIRIGALLHDIGKVGIPAEILIKPDQLTKKEREIVLKHPEIGYKILEKLPDLAKAAEIVYSHHERFDGTGYPRGLKGNDIYLGARIFSVIDTYDAMRYDRHFSAGSDTKTILSTIKKESGLQFDPKVVEVFIENFEKFEFLNINNDLNWEL